jgi:hypothetical protein
LKEQLLLSKQIATYLLKPNPLKGGDTMKKQKLLTIFFCCALLIGVSSVAANAQELAGTTYTLFIYPAGQASFNADVNFLENGVTQIGIADSAGAGSYYEAAPSFLASYRALGVTLGETTGDLSLYMLGTTLSEGELMIGLGVALFTVTDSNVPFTTFWFYGRLIA